MMVSGKTGRLISSLVAISALLFCCVAQEQAVTATGRAFIAGGNIDAARTKALSDAFRNAVEKGIGVWIASNTTIENNMQVKDQLLSRSEGYVTAHEVVKEGSESGDYVMVIRATVSVDKIGADFKAIVGRVKTQMNNPSIAFVLTTWQKRGAAGTYSTTHSYDEKDNASSAASGSASLTVSDAERYRDTEARSGSSSSGTVSASGTYAASGQRSSTASSAASGSSAESGSYSKIDESLWKKYPDPSIIDAFQQEFKEKSFDIMAADKAREIALTESLAATSVNPNDRAAVRAAAEKEGANYVARGEVSILDCSKSAATGNFEASAKIGCEIIDVNSGDVVASYSSTAKAANTIDEMAMAEVIKKCAVLAARTLADQTISTWQERSNNGRQYTIEIRNMTSMRSQKMPLIKALETVVQITSQTSPDPTTLLLKVMYKGEKNALGEGIINAIGDRPGFGEKEFDGPIDEAGKIVFVFTTSPK